ncbi:hypothetical protein GCM10011611_40260 [Aliidongia dinghuensis]|uniref:Lysozyme inhibitor LprI-like N-terminal domain-containing protein n=1 Tax=Aliidongia dinghuensis TaxID=1867774 RepID=A0A8J2YXN5_9PROT|nr:lysozyme inhibitor LprI family protein [Aliidongia dinghuensis]GGF30112.1 hypothetical protein GCM10011611_40260 [Aliidongia dinghuensis]
MDANEYALPIAKLRFLPVLALALAFRPVPAHAADCASASDQATMNACAAQAYKQADAALNGLYQQAEQRLKNDSEQMKRLVAAERTWIAFRDAECKFVGAPASGGSADGTVLATCLTALTTKRSADLKGFLSCPEGDLACPLPPE